MFTLIETPLFTRLLADYLSAEEYRKLQRALADNPEVGPIVPGSGRVRKLRWAMAGGLGKERRFACHLLRALREGVILMLTLYPENVAENIAAHVLRQIRQEIDHG